MSELTDFGLIVLIVAGSFSLALGGHKLTELVPIPAPAIFLAAAAVASDIWPGLSRLSTVDVERIAVVALVAILFDGGMHVGWDRFRAAALPITALGVLGTFATAGIVAVAAHWLFDFGWTTAGIVGAALAPTDPAVMFSVLGRREIGGRTGTILEGESGANDPVGIALMIGMLDYATHAGASFWTVVREFAIEMSVGLAIGLAGAAVLLRLMRHVALPNEALYPLRTLALAGVIYGVASVAHGSGFLAVFVAGLLVGASRAPYKGEIERFHTSLASLAEIVVFVALGLTVDLGSLDGRSVWLDGALLALILAFVARPLACAPLLLPARLRTGERLFVLWGGLKGAVPILLAAFAVIAGAQDAGRIYGIVFVVVLLSVVVQGTSIPFVAPRLGVPMRLTERHGVARVEVAAGSRAEGHRIRELPLAARTWVEAVERDGQELPARGSTVLQAGDRVRLITDLGDVDTLRRLFGGERQAPDPAPTVPAEA
ncbi:MAG TPA: cation:proton antiporter [Gaiellaceae bacterium]|nr:cation:proton antiporter [Gaiellaceae bacterium]